LAGRFEVGNFLLIITYLTTSKPPCPIRRRERRTDKFQFFLYSSIIYVYVYIKGDFLSSSLRHLSTGNLVIFDLSSVEKNFLFFKK